MRQSAFQINKRQKMIVEHLQKDGVVYVSKLGEAFNVSEITIRRDLAILEKTNMLIRFHGGAKLANEELNDVQLFEEKGKKNIEEKLLIARRAAELIRDGDMIFMNSGSTIIHIPQFIQNKCVTIITNNTKMSSVKFEENVCLLLTGGIYNKVTQSLTGDLTNHALQQVYATICILGVNGISAEAGITTSVYQETEVNNMMLKRCRGNRIVVADSSKIGRSLHFISAPINMIDVLVTTSKADPGEIEKLKARGVKVIVEPFEK